jgi:uncharacterized membrane protein
MKRVRIFGEVIIVGLLIGTFLSSTALVRVSYGADAAYKFKIEDIPLHFTFLGQEHDDILRLTDMNSKGEMVGNNFVGDGFLVNKNHKVIEIRCPGDRTDNDSTEVSAINNLGQVVGSCTDGVSPNQKLVGFVRDRNGNFNLLNFPGAEGTIAFGINDLGHVVGQYFGDDFGEGLDQYHGFVWRNGVYASIDAAFPEAMTTSLLGINNFGQIIGTYLHHRPGSSDINDYDSEEAFLYDNGIFTPLDFPGAKTPFVCCGAATFPMDINNLGQVIGSTYDGLGNPRFFLYDNGEYFVITGVPDNVIDSYDFSVVHGSSAWGINDQSEIAGTYVQRVPCDACGPGGQPGFELVPHSFVAKPKKAPKTVAPVIQGPTLTQRR